MGCDELGVEFFPSQANFVLMKIGRSTRSWCRRCGRVACCCGTARADPGCDGFVRITIGVEEHVTRGLAALKSRWRRLDGRRSRWLDGSAAQRCGTGVRVMSADADGWDGEAGYDGDADLR